MTETSEMTDQEITAGIKNGNMPAYKQLFLKYYVPIRRFLTVILNDFETAQDVAQDIFLKVWLNRDGLDLNKSIKSLVYTMARNTAVNHLRQKSGKLAGDIEDYVVTSSETTEKVEADSLQSYILLRIMKMPQKRRRIFMMSRYDGMKNKEIAARLGLSVRTVEKHIELALKDLRQGGV